MRSRFDHVTFDTHAQGVNDHITRIAQELEDAIISNIGSGRSVSTALTRLEESIAWARKGIRDDVQDREEAVRILGEKINQDKNY